MEISKTKRNESVASIGYSCFNLEMDGFPLAHQPFSRHIHIDQHNRNNMDL